MVEVSSTGVIVTSVNVEGGGDVVYAQDRSGALEWAHGAPE